jgi:hypothetical protein
MLQSAGKRKERERDGETQYFDIFFATAVSNTYMQNQSITNGTFTIFTCSVIILLFIHISNGACSSVVG